MMLADFIKADPAALRAEMEAMLARQEREFEALRMRHRAEVRAASRQMSAIARVAGV